MAAVKRILADLQTDIDVYFQKWGKYGIGENDFFDHTTQEIAYEIFETAKERSPYLYGFLHDAHRVSRENNAWVIHIDPTAKNTIMGGKPYIYGYLIHTEGRGRGGHRPWFEWAIQESADHAVFRRTGDLNSHFAEVFTAPIFQGVTSAGQRWSLLGGITQSMVSQLGDSLNFLIDSL